MKYQILLSGKKIDDKYLKMSSAENFTQHHKKFDPLKPHFYLVKLGLKGVYIVFLFLLKNV